MGVCYEEAKYGRAIHRAAKNSGPLQGYGVDAMDVGSKKLLVKGGLGYGGSEVGGSRSGRRQRRKISGDRVGVVAGN